MSKEEKYDRQLRLWQSQGQSSLENAHVLIISPTVASIELLKDLVLPNVGHFTLLDIQREVNEIDIGNNFFFDDDDLGKDRLEVLTKNINELNSDVKGTYINCLGDLIENIIDDQNPSFWKQFDLIVYNWNNDALVRISDELNIPLLIINAFGFFGVLRVYKPYFEVIETHPNTNPDLRILYPWKELQDYSDSIDLDSLDVERHSKVPYLIIQLKAVQAWLENNKNKLPQSFEERSNFKKLIVSWKKDAQLNFDEAIKHSHKIFDKTKVPSNISTIFSQIAEHESDEDEFWCLVKALKRFTELSDGLLPISGELPDMDSDTDNYRILKKIYANKFAADESKFIAILNTITARQFDPIKVRTFLKNSKHLFFSKNLSSILDLDIYQSKILNNSDLAASNGGYDFRLVILAYLLIEDYYNEFLQFPSNLSDLEDSISFIPENIKRVIPMTQLKPMLFELIRGENIQLSNVSSFMGGIGAQEAIKLITKQYIPLDNFLVYDGIHSITERVKL